MGGWPAGHDFSDRSPFVVAGAPTTGVRWCRCGGGGGTRDGGCHDAAVAGVGESIGRVEAGFLIERLHEPRPTAAAADIDRDDYERLTREPTGLGSHRGWHLATTMNCAFPSCLRRSRAGLSHEALHFLRFRQAPLAPDFKCRYPHLPVRVCLNGNGPLPRRQ